MKEFKVKIKVSSQWNKESLKLLHKHIAGLGYRFTPNMTSKYKYLFFHYDGTVGFDTELPFFIYSDIKEKLTLEQLFCLTKGDVE